MREAPRRTTTSPLALRRLLGLAAIVGLALTLAPREVRAGASADATWSKLALPPPTYSRVPAFDPADGALVLFGEATEAEFWRFDLDGGAGWSRDVIVGGPPVVRSLQARVFDRVRNRLLALGFGGDWDSTGMFYPLDYEVWELPLGPSPAWRRVTTTGQGPDGRYAPSVVIDEATSTLYLVGGTYEFLNPEYHLVPLLDAWALNLTNGAWSPVAANGTGPAGLYDGQAAFVPATGSIVIFGASDSTLDNQSDERVWRLDVGGDGAWHRQRDLPEDRQRSFYLPDPSGNGVLAFQSTREDDDAIVHVQWTYDIADSGSWTPTVLPSDPNLPPFQPFAQVHALDPVRGRFVTVGGYKPPLPGISFPMPCADVWSRPLDSGAAWTGHYGSLHTDAIDWIAPPVHDPARHRFVAPGYPFGFALDAGAIPAWSPVPHTGSTPPGPRGESVTVFDPAGDRLVLYGGVLNGAELGDLWTLSYAVSPARWSRIVPTGDQPTPRRAAAAIHDPLRHRMILFGGLAGVPSDETWELDLRESAPTWRQLATRGIAPPGRWGHSAIYDSRRDALVIFGGTTGQASSPVYLRDAWTLSLDEGATWVPLAPEGGLPVGRRHHGAVYDPIGDRMLMMGGQDAGGSRSEVKQLVFEPVVRWDDFLPIGSAPPFYQRPVLHYDAAADRVLVFATDGPLAGGVPVLAFDRPGATPPPYPEGGPAVRLLGVGPNPSRGEVTVAFDLPRPTAVRLRLHDVRGRVVRDLAARNFTAGPHTIVLDGRDDDGARLGDGVYFALLEAEGTRITGKLVLMD